MNIADVTFTVSIEDGTFKVSNKGVKDIILIGISKRNNKDKTCFCNCLVTGVDYISPFTKCSNCDYKFAEVTLGNVYGNRDYIRYYCVRNKIKVI